jgi:hypothetical protein
MDNNLSSQHTNIISNKKKKKFYDVDLDLNFQNSEKIDIRDTETDLSANIINECEEDKFDTANDESISITDVSSKGPRKQTIPTTQQDNHKQVNSSFFEIYDEKAKYFSYYKTQLKLNYSLIKNIKEIKILNPSLRMLCYYCKEIEFEPKWIDYKEGKFYSMLCPKCEWYLIVYHEIKEDEHIFGVYNFETKVISADYEVRCNCGQVFKKEKFTSGNLYESKKCDSCSEHISLLDCNVVTSYAASKNLFNFTKDDLIKLFSKYGFCTEDPVKYGFKLKIESNDQKEKVLGRHHWKHKYIEKTVNRKKLIIEKVINKK